MKLAVKVFFTYLFAGIIARPEYISYSDYIKNFKSYFRPSELKETSKPKEVKKADNALWSVSLRLYEGRSGKIKTKPNKEKWCTGTIWTDNMLITSASCFDEFLGNKTLLEIEIFMNLNNNVNAKVFYDEFQNLLNLDQVVRPDFKTYGDKVTIHDGYNKKTRENNLCTVRLDRKEKFSGLSRLRNLDNKSYMVETIFDSTYFTSTSADIKNYTTKLYSHGNLNADKRRANGFYHRNEEVSIEIDAGSETNHQIDSIIPISECGKKVLLGNNIKISGQNNFCTTSPKAREKQFGAHDAYFTGSPLVAKINDGDGLADSGSPLLIGIVSSEKYNCGQYPGEACPLVFTKVASYADWLSDVELEYTFLEKFECNPGEECYEKSKNEESSSWKGILKTFIFFKLIILSIVLKCLESARKATESKNGKKKRKVKGKGEEDRDKKNN